MIAKMAKGAKPQQWRDGRRSTASCQHLHQHKVSVANFYSLDRGIGTWQW